MLEALLALPFVLAALIACTPGLSRRNTALLAAVAPLGGLALLASLTPRVLGGEILRSTHAWIPSVGLDFALRIDGYAWMFGGLVLAIGALIVLYAHYYLSPRDSARRFYGLLLLFMGAMLGLAISGNLLLLVVFWELTSVSSFLLIGFWRHRADARQGARMALTVTGGGGLALLAGVVVLGRIVGSYDLDTVLASGELVRAHALYPAALVLILLGAFTKSAQFPFHFWLPHAMAAPTPISAYLHSAAMVKAGVFLIARLHPTLAGSELFFILVCCAGAATFLVGSFFAIWQHDLKGLLAYSTISHLGLITLLFGLSTPMAVVAGLFHILNHATFKASLFMAAGIIDHETGTRDLRRLGGLRRLMPWTSALAVVATLAMAGVPLLNGFLSKEMFFTEAADLPGPAWVRNVMSGIAVLGGLFSVAYSLRFLHDAFLGTAPRDIEITAHEPPRFMRVPVEVLVVLCVAVGVLPAYTIAPVLAAGVSGVLGAAAPDYYLAIWHGFNLPLVMSIVSLVGGLALYALLRRQADIHALTVESWIGPWFRAGIRGLGLGSAAITVWMERGGIRRDILLVMLAAAALAATAIMAGPGIRPPGDNQPLGVLGALLWLVTVATAVATTLLHRDRFKAVLVLGGTGLGVSLAFVMLSAPDLALTQLLVEMATIALVLLAMNYLPRRSPPEAAGRRLRDALIAVVAGVLVMASVYAVITHPFETVGAELLARALPDGGGTNVVNVILVDFRGFDTLGEICVFAMAGLVVHALLRRSRIVAERSRPGRPPTLTIPATAVQVLFPLALTVSAYLFLRGHNQPGGGFIAGLVFAIPLLMQYLLSGRAFVDRRLRLSYARFAAAGLFAAAATGLGAILLGWPFLTSGELHPVLPLIGELHVSSVLGFDLGVYLAVAGATLLALITLARIRKPLWAMKETF